MCAYDICWLCQSQVFVLHIFTQKFTVSLNKYFYHVSYFEKYSYNINKHKRKYHFYDRKYISRNYNFKYRFGYLHFYLLIPYHENWLHHQSMSTSWDSSINAHRKSIRFADYLKLVVVSQVYPFILLFSTLLLLDIYTVLYLCNINILVPRNMVIRAYYTQ